MIPKPVEGSVVGENLESLKVKLEETRTELVDAYWDELVYQQGGSGKRVRNVKREIKKTRKKAKKNDDGSPLILVNDATARESYRRAKRAYDVAFEAYLHFLSLNADAQAVLDAEMAEHQKLDSLIETRLLQRGLKKGFEGIKGFATYVARGIAETRKTKAIQWVERVIKNNQFAAALLAFFSAAGLMWLFPIVAPIILGAAAGIIVRKGVSEAIKTYHALFGEYGKLKKIDEELNTSWEEAKRAGVPYATWRKDNAGKINHRAKVALQAQRAGAAAGLTATIVTFILTGHGIGWNLAHHGAGFDVADISFASSASAAPRPDVPQPEKSPLDRGVPGIGTESQAQTVFEAYSEEIQQFTIAEKQFNDAINFLKTLVGPEDDAYLDRIAENYRMAKTYALEDLNRLNSKEFLDSATQQEILNLENKLRRNIGIMQLCQQYIFDQGNDALANPEKFRRFGLTRIRLTSADPNIVLASAEISSGVGGQGQTTELAYKEKGPLIPSDDPRLGGRPDDPAFLRGELSLEKLLAEIERLSEIKKTRIDPLVSKLLAIGGPTDPAYLAAKRIQGGYASLITQLTELKDEFAEFDNSKKKILAGQPDVFRRFRFGSKEWNLKELLRNTGLRQLGAMDENLGTLEDLVKSRKPGQVLIDGAWQYLSDEVAFKDARGDMVTPELARGIRDFVTKLHEYGWILEGDNYDGKLDNVIVTEGGEAVKGDHAPRSRHMGPDATAFDLRSSRDPARVAYMLAIDQLVDGVYAEFEIDGSKADLARLRASVTKILLDPDGPYVKKPFYMTPEKVARIVNEQIGINEGAQARDAAQGTNKHTDHFHIELRKPKAVGTSVASLEPPIGTEAGFIEVADRGPRPYNPDLGKTPVTPQNAEVLGRIGNMSVGEITDIETYQEFLTQQKEKVAETLRNYLARLVLLEKTAEMNPDLSLTDIEVVKSAIAATSADAGEQIATRLQGVITGPFTAISAEELRIRATADVRRITQPVLAIRQQVEALERIAKSGMPNVRPGTGGIIGA